MIALKILCVPYNTEEIRHAYKSKYLNRENQVILFIITDGKKWPYHVVKGLSALLREIASNNDGDFYYINCLHSLKSIIMYEKIMIIVM